MIVTPPQIIIFGCQHNHPILLLRNNIPLFLLVLKQPVRLHLCIPKQFRYLKTRLATRTPTWSRHHTLLSFSDSTTRTQP